MYKSSYKCSDCKYQFEKKTKNFPHKDPDCPRCKRANKVSMKGAVSDKTHTLEPDSRVQEMNLAKQAPSLGKSNFTKAMDTTAEIVMKDYGMTDLQDNLREGDSMAPKLAPELERKVDGVFKQQKPIMGQQVAGSMNSSLMRQINSGAFRGAVDVVARQQASGIAPPKTTIIHEYGRNKPN